MRAKRVRAVVAIVTLCATGCGDDAPSGAGSASGSNRPPATTTTAVPGVEAVLADIVQAAAPGLPEEVCESIGDILQTDPGSSERVDGWNDDVAEIEVELRSRVAPAAEDVLDRWLTVAKADMAAKSAWYVAGGQASARDEAVAFQNPRGLDAEARAAARHDDAWLKLYLTQACSTNAPDWVKARSVDTWKWEMLTKGASTPDPEFDDVPAELVDWSGTVLDTLTADGFAAAYAKHGSTECVAAVEDPLVAHWWDYQMFRLTHHRDGEPYTVGVSSRPEEIQFDDTTQPDGYVGFGDAIPVVAGGVGYLLDDASCFAPIRAPFSRYG